MNKDSDANLTAAATIMEEFAESSGLQPVASRPRRYLWTDAFAVCNFLGLYDATGRERYRDLALLLVDQVHHILGRHRREDPRRGWISGLDDDEAEDRPTAGGLRIGKKISERQPDEPFDGQLEWDRDGQYYHYLTKWMQALDRVGRATGEERYLRWAVELARVAHRAFSYQDSSGERKRLYWKMSTDLTRPLVASMGHHDPLDGLITYCQLQVSGKAGSGESGADLENEISDLDVMCQNRDWATDDPLGLGGLLSDAYRVAQLLMYNEGGVPSIPVNLLDEILSAALAGMVGMQRDDFLATPAPYRLAFRELGLAIGLQTVPRLEALIARRPTFAAVGSSGPALLNALSPYLPMATTINEFWLQRENQNNSTWIGHRDINMVMLATSLAPDGYLSLSG